MAWLGAADGLDPRSTDGLGQVPAEVASTLDVKRVLGAASGLINLDRKVEVSSTTMHHAIADLASHTRLEISKVRGHLGELEASIHVAARAHVQDELSRCALPSGIDIVVPTPIECGSL